jgi:hypothetical protein
MFNVSLSIPDRVGESLSMLLLILVSILAAFLVVHVVQCYILGSMCRKLVKLVGIRNETEHEQRDDPDTPECAEVMPAGCRPFREWHSVDEFARIVGRTEITCREWCRLGRIRAKRKESGRGAAAWIISRAELERFQRHGLLSQPQPE